MNYAGTTPTLVTPREIASRVKAPLHRVLYVLRARSIRPRARAGIVRVYDSATVQLVRQELNAIAAARLLGGMRA